MREGDTEGGDAGTGTLWDCDGSLAEVGWMREDARSLVSLVDTVVDAGS